MPLKYCLAIFSASLIYVPPEHGNVQSPASDEDGKYPLVNVVGIDAKIS